MSEHATATNPMAAQYDPTSQGEVRAAAAAQVAAELDDEGRFRATGTGEPVDAAEIEEALRDVIDPELGINVVDLGLLYGVAVEPDGTVVLDMTLTTAACPLTDVVEEQAQQVLSDLVDRVRIQWVWLPPWGPDKITPEGRDQLRALGFNV